MNTINLMVLLGTMGPLQIGLIILVALLFFGGKKIPELMRGLGQGVQEFKKASKTEEEKKSTETEKDSEKK